MPLDLSIIQTWDPDLREMWEERAAILEYDGGFSREEAETLAFEMLTPSKKSDEDFF